MSLTSWVPGAVRFERQTSIPWIPSSWAKNRVEPIAPSGCGVCPLTGWVLTSRNSRACVNPPVGCAPEGAASKSAASAVGQAPVRTRGVVLYMTRFSLGG